LEEKTVPFEGLLVLRQHRFAGRRKGDGHERIAVGNVNIDQAWVGNCIYGSKRVENLL
jgi:hypothetical protein